MEKKSYLSLLCIILLLLPVLSGCGKTASKEGNSLLGIDGYVYTARQIESMRKRLPLSRTVSGIWCRSEHALQDDKGS